MARVGVLIAEAAPARTAQVQALRERLAELGWIDGRSVRIDVRYGDGDAAALRAAADALVKSGVRLMVAAGTQAALAARAATRLVPIVMIGVGDPVARGLVETLARPGGSVTGSSDALPDGNERRLRTLRQAFPGVRRVTFLANPALTPRAPIEAAAARLALEVDLLAVRDLSDFAPAYAALARQPPDALIVIPNPLAFAERQRIAAFGLEHRIAVVFGWREFMDAPALFSLGANLGTLFRDAADTCDRILRGAAPAELAVAQPDFELVLNRSVARRLGLIFDRSLVEAAAEIIP